MSKALWRVTGSRKGALFTTKVRAASWREAVRIGSTTHKLVVRDCMLLDETSPEVLQAKCIATAPSITPPAPSTRLRRNRQTKIYTDEALARIPELLEQGLNRAQIAEQLGGKVTSLQVVCSRKGISLQRRDRRRLPNVLPDAALTVQLKARTVSRLQQRAEAKGISETTLAARLLDLIANEDLYDAVLDEAAI
jgi:hypothetical protein